MAGAAGKSKSGSSKKGRQHVAHQKKYQKQWTRTYANKEKAWSRHLEQHHNDKQAKEQISNARKNIRTRG